jgi:hypothetical protein
VIETVRNLVPERPVVTKKSKRLNLHYASGRIVLFSLIRVPPATTGQASAPRLMGSLRMRHQVTWCAPVSAIDAMDVCRTKSLATIPHTASSGAIGSMYHRPPCLTSHDALLQDRLEGLIGLGLSPQQPPPLGRGDCLLLLTQLGARQLSRRGGKIPSAMMIMMMMMTMMMTIITGKLLVMVVMMMPASTTSPTSLACLSSRVQQILSGAAHRQRGEEAFPPVGTDVLWL